MKVAVIGLGHIGGSFAKALLESNVYVTCYDSDECTRTHAKDAGLRCTDNVSDALSGADLVVLATPTSAIPMVLAEVVDCISKWEASAAQVVISDLSSTKSGFLDTAYEMVARLSSSTCHDVEYLSLHPMAGREGSGFDSSDAQLIRSSTWAILMDQEHSFHAISVAMKVIGHLDGKGLFIDPKVHDQAVALISHVPHLMSLAYTQLLENSQIRGISLSLKAGSFKDMTRVAKTNSEKVAAMVVPNRDNLVTLVDDLIDILGVVKSNMRTQDSFVEFASPLAAFLSVTEQADNIQLSSKAITVRASELNAVLKEICTGGGLVQSISTDKDAEHVRVTFFKRQSS